MKKYQKVRVIAKNQPQGSYVAGCGNRGTGVCYNCERKF